MSSRFDTAVQARRNHTPWASVAFLRFIKEVLWNVTDDPQKNGVVLRATHRHDVASRNWFELEWTGEDNERHHVQAQEFDLLMWRAAQAEMDVRRQLEYQRRDIAFAVGVFGQRCESDPTFTKRLDAHMEAVRKSSDSQIMEVYEKESGHTVLIARDGWTFTPQDEQP